MKWSACGARNTAINQEKLSNIDVSGKISYEFKPFMKSLVIEDRFFPCPKGDLLIQV
jgi:hypothetical protein